MIRAGAVSSAEVVEAHLRRIDAINPTVCAVVQLPAEEARAAARRADDELAGGGAVGPLHGVPFTVKDWIETEGVICAAGIEDRKDYVPKRDATVVARLRAAGAILVAKTKPNDDDAVYPRPQNPYDLARTPGASSSGEAAIIAACGSPLGVGSDSGGSLRFPAHCCGIATIKPTAGLVPLTGHFPRIGALSDPRTQIGPMARHVADLVLALRIIAGPDGHDPAVVPMPLQDPSAVTVSGLRGALVPALPGAAPTEATAAALRTAVVALEAAGVEIEEAMAPRIEESLEITRWYWQRARSYSWKRWESPPSTLSADEIERSIFAWERLQRDMVRFMERYDIVMSPACPHPAPLHDAARVEDFIYTLPWSLTGYPSAVVRAGTSPEGLPIGVQIVARPWRDDVALAVGAHLEQALGPFDAPAL